LTEVLPFDKNLVVIGADQIPEIDTMVRNNWKSSRYNIGAIFWETDIIPPKVHNSLSIFDEFIVSSNYIAKNLERFTDKKISVVGLPIESNGKMVTKIFNDDNLTIYFNFDYLSDIYRKNVYSLVDYVKRKNKETKSKFNLILKSINGKYFPLEKAYLNHLISGDDNIRELDTFLGNEDFQRLISKVDIYVSLHRSEGFGLGLAEAMAFGIPTMATAHSGNLDFMNPYNSYLIDFNLEPIANSRRSPYSEFGGTWAQPKYESFSDQIDDLLSHSEERFLRITKAKNMIHNEFSTLSITDKMKNALRSSGII
jgi:glycosyltransferase involved in cell wall biosynthesis